MLKNKLKIIVLLTIIILSLTLPIVRAENETTDNVVAPNVTTTSENTPNEVETVPNNTEVDTNNNTVATPSEENFKRNDVYLMGDDVTIDYIVDGNLFVLANHVTINSQIGGDAFICSNSVTIGDQGYIFSNLFTFSKNVIVNGVVYDLYSASENTTINGYVYRDVHIGSNVANILGTIGRNARIDCNTLNFTKEENGTSIQGKINGNLSYTASNEASIPEGSVTGETNFKQLTYEENSIQNRILQLGTFVVTVIGVWLFILWLAPKFLKNNVSYLTTKKVLPAIGLGILVPILSIVLAIIFLLLGITSTLSILIFFALFILAAISTSIFMITVNNVICNKLKIEKTITTFGMLIALSIVFWLIGLIPYLGSILGIIVMILGLGIIFSNLILKPKKETVTE